MVHPYETSIVEQAATDATARIADAANNESLTWEDVSRIASEENQRLLRVMDMAKRVATTFVESNTDAAICAGIYMFEQARSSVDPEFIPDLIEGVNALVARVAQQAEAGRVIPLNYMDPNTRKELFLVESYIRAGPATT